MKVINIEDNKEFLRQKSKNVEKNDPDLKKNIEVLEKYCCENAVFAMAAVQLGIPKRIIYIKNTNLDKYIDDSDYNEAKVLINPVIIKRRGLTRYWEGCASCLDYTGLVERPYYIEIEYYDINFKKQRVTLEGFESTVFSHEYDHLDGILHMDIALEIKVMPREERKEFRKEHGYEIISTDCEYDNRGKITLNKKYR